MLLMERARKFQRATKLDAKGVVVEPGVVCIVRSCKEYTSYYRKLATKTVSIQQEELQEH